MTDGMNQSRPAGRPGTARYGINNELHSEIDSETGPGRAGPARAKHPDMLDPETYREGVIISHQGWRCPAHPWRWPVVSKTEPGALHCSARDPDGFRGYCERWSGEPGNDLRSYDYD